MRILKLTTAAALALAAAACGGQDADNQLTTDANLAEDIDTNEMLGDANQTAPSATPTDAAGFAAAVAASDLYEIESSALAASKARSAELKSHAEHIGADHRKSSADLKAAAASANVTVTPQLDAEKQAMLDQLKAASDADFDRLFVEQQRTAHQKALQLLQTYAASGDNAELKAFAGKAVPIVQGHLETLNGLKL